MENLTIERQDDHRYLVRAQQQGQDTVEILMRASPAIIDRLTGDGLDEIRVIEAAIGYLIARQRIDDLPPQLDLDDMAAAYEGFEHEVRRRLEVTTG